jgi:hypothetical protein
LRRPLVEFNVSQEQLEKMFGPSNDLTTLSWEKIWMDNVVENLNICPNPRPMMELVTNVNKHITFVVGAGPSVRKLKKHAAGIHPDWGVITTDQSLKAVLEAGLKPTLVVTMDGHQKTEDVILEGFDMLAELHPDVPVVIDLVCCPSVAEKVKNPFWFRNHGESDHIISKYVNREAPQVSIMGHGGNVGSVCAIMSKFICFSRHVVLIGLDSAMKEGTKRDGYWYGRIMPESHAYLDVSDIYGRPIVTMANLHNYKWWMDHFTYQNDDVEWINANDGGFLGVCSATANYNHYKYMPLPEAIAHLQAHGEED